MKKKNKKEKSYMENLNVISITEVKKRFKNLIPRFLNSQSNMKLQNKNELFYGIKEFIEDHKLIISFIGLTLILILSAIVSK